MPNSQTIQFKEAVLVHLNRIAPVTARGMFGGYGLYLEGTMFGLIADSRLYFKVGDSNRKDFRAAGTLPFVYHRQGREVAMSYYELPAAVYEDLSQLDTWVQRAHAAARQSKQR